MKLRTTIIAILLMALVLGASPMGYCYSNVVAKTTTDEVSDYKSSTQIGLSPGVQLGIASGTILGSGYIAGVGTYFVASSASALALDKIGEYMMAEYLSSGGDAPLFEDVLMTVWASHSPLGATVSAMPYAAAAGVAIVVVVVTATGVYLLWSAS